MTSSSSSCPLFTIFSSVCRTEDFTLLLCQGKVKKNLPFYSPPMLGKGKISSPFTLLMYGGKGKILHFYSTPVLGKGKNSSVLLSSCAREREEFFSFTLLLCQGKGQLLPFALLLCQGKVVTLPFTLLLCQGKKLILRFYSPSSLRKGKNSSLFINNLLTSFLIPFSISYLCILSLCAHLILSSF